MADGLFNIARGRFVEFYNRVVSNDPTNAALVVVLCFGSETDDTIRDADTLAAVLATSLSEATFTNYARKVLTDSDLASLPAPDDTNDRYDIDLPDQTWSVAGGAVNNTLTRLLVCYDSDTTGGTDANIVPIFFFDITHTTNGGDLTVQFNADVVYRAS